MSRCQRPLSQTVAAVPPSGIRRFFELVSQMEDVIALGVGEPDFPTPWSIASEAVAGLKLGRTSYTSNYGLLSLRRAISRHLQRLYQVTYDPEKELLVTVGVSEGLDLALRAILNPGDEVVVPQPCYVSYVPGVIFAGGVPVPVETSVERGFVVSPEQVEAALTPRTKALLIGHPNNPTGAVLPETTLRTLAELAEGHDLLVISDEIYDRLRYGTPHCCFASLPGMKERTILLNGFSKAYSMTGWRVGYAAAPAEILALMVKIHQYTMLCAPITGQLAALEALRWGENAVRRMVREYDRRRRFLVQGLNRLGLECLEPQGAFYAFPSIRRTGLSSEEFCQRLLREERVAVVPGNAFGPCGEGHVRMTYATSLDHLREALVRLERFLSRL
ncbi:MAG TPA: aminotransferase class I/II-fold pyridoxal phosphate-dependent enzyme [Armatimonadetes bacterium]|nr:aminotransferase class I/II-fold pyridoxal phosphate-dependent enzyme [Armatimonadota bacterium]